MLVPWRRTGDAEPGRQAPRAQGVAGGRCGLPSCGRGRSLQGSVA